MKQDSLAYMLAKILSASVIMGVFFVCKNPSMVHLLKSIDTNHALSKTFSVYRTSTTSFLDELKAPAIPVRQEEPVFNPQVVNELEEENQPQEPVYQEQIESDNSVALINYEDVTIKNHTNKEFDVLKLMENYAPPKKKDAPQILIIHTHATEGFADQPTSRTTDTEKNVVKIGSYIEELLEKKGFNVLHDIVLHDYPNYNQSYKNSLDTANWYLEHYPEIDIVFDIHRDAILDEKGNRTKLTYTHKNKKYAQLMLVSGTDQGGLTHESWQENLKFAIGLQAVANKMYNGLMRPIDLRVERFNGHLTKNALIVEFGTDGNTLKEALSSAELLAEILNEYIK